MLKHDGQVLRFHAPVQEWREIENGQDREEFRKITELLVQFDEHSGRYRRFGDPEVHYMRKAITVADAWRLRVFLQRLEPCLFYVVAELGTETGSVATAWLHEDGVRMERELLADEPEHPVHGIACLTDLFERAKVIPEDFAEVLVTSATLELLSRPPED